MAARKGLSLYTKESSVGTLNITSLGAKEEVKIDNSPKKTLQKKGDFIYKYAICSLCTSALANRDASRVDDMLAILFPHMYEEPDYPIPVDTTATAADESVQDRIQVPTSNSTNVIAGPSRLPYNA